MAYCVLFYAVWTLREFCLRPIQADLMGPLAGAFVAGAVKLLLWTLPAWLLVRRYPGDMLVPRWFGQKVAWPRVLPWLAVIVGYNVATAWIGHGALRIHPDFRPITLIGTVLFVGITEEAVFRGLLLNTFATRMKEDRALLVSAALFVLIHVPIWITKGVFADIGLMVGSIATVLVLGVGLGMSFLREHSLLPPIVLHMAWNLCVVLLQGG